MAKIKKSNTQKEYDAKNLTPYEIYKNMQSWRQTPISGAFIEKFCQDMIDWSFREKSFCLTQFLRWWGVNEKYFYEWLHKYPEIQDAYWFAMSSMGDKREIGALTRQYDSGTAEKPMSAYSSTWAAVEERRAKLRREEQGSTIEDLSNCVHKLVQQKWGDDEADTGTTTETPEVSTETIPIQDR